MVGRRPLSSDSVRNPIITIRVVVLDGVVIEPSGTETFRHRSGDDLRVSAVEVVDRQGDLLLTLGKLLCVVGDVHLGAIAVYQFSRVGVQIVLLGDSQPGNVVERRLPRIRVDFLDRLRAWPRAQDAPELCAVVRHQLLYG